MSNKRLTAADALPRTKVHTHTQKWPLRLHKRKYTIMNQSA